MTHTQGSEHDTRATDPGTLLRIYLNDHRSGAAGGLALARRSQRNNQGSELGRELETIVRDLEQDAATLDAVRRRMHVRDDPWKQAAARVGEIVGRLKLNGRLRGYSELSRVLELELLLAGIDAKRSLWRALASCGRDSLRDFDFDQLAERASDQRSRLIPFHRDAASASFGPRA